PGAPWVPEQHASIPGDRHCGNLDARIAPQVSPPAGPRRRSDGSAARAAVLDSNGADDLAVPPEARRVQPVEVGVHAVEQAGPGPGVDPVQPGPVSAPAGG